MPDENQELDALRQVRADLDKANEALRQLGAELNESRHEIDTYQKKLRQMATELSLAEERERRAIASNLHDHVGQALAFIKLKLQQLRGDAIFSGFEKSFDQVLVLLAQTITYTRTLTFELSPPVLYELGLPAALKWLRDDFQAKWGLDVRLRLDKGADVTSDELKVVLFKSARELLTNAAKHSGSRCAELSLDRVPEGVRLAVRDLGRGLDPRVLNHDACTTDKFGLFSIRERISVLGGSMEISSPNGQGACVTLTTPTGGKP